MTHRYTNIVVALAQAEIEVKLEMQVGVRLTDTYAKGVYTGGGGNIKYY